MCGANRTVENIAALKSYAVHVDLMRVLLDKIRRTKVCLDTERGANPLLHLRAISIHAFKRGK